MNKFLLSLICLLVLASIVNSAPWNCARGAKQLLSEDAEDALDLDLLGAEPCADHNICEIKCGVYFPHCTKTVYFNLDPLIPKYPTPTQGQTGYEEYQAYSLVCSQKKFSEYSESNAAVYRIFNKYVSQYFSNFISWESLNNILHSPQGEWDTRYENFWNSLNLNFEQKIIAQGLHKLAVALRNFKKVCPQQNVSIYTLLAKFHEFDQNYWQDMLKSTERDLQSNPGLKSYKLLLEVLNNKNFLAQSILHQQQVITYWHNQAYWYRNYYAWTPLQQAHQYYNYLVQSDIAWTNVINKFFYYKGLIINEVMNLYLNPKFQQDGGNYCQCYDFVRFSSWNVATPAWYSNSLYGIRQDVVKANFDGKYLPQMQQQCRKECYGY
jgi:hypothetical protein